MTTQSMGDGLVLQAVSAPLERAPAPAPNRPTLRRLLVALDAAAVTLAWITAFAVFQPVHVAPAREALAQLGGVVALAACSIALIAGQRLYLARYCAIRAVEIARLGRAAALAAGVAFVAPHVLPIAVSGATAAGGAALGFVATMFLRGLYRHWLQVGRREGRFLRPVIVIGTNDEGWDLVKLLHDHPEIGFRVVGVVGDGPGPDEAWTVPWLGTPVATAGAIRSTGATGVLIAGSALDPPELNAITRSCLDDGVHVHLSNGLRGIDYRRVRAHPLAHEPLFYLEPLMLAPWQTGVKRAIDLVLSIVGGLFIALPLVTVAAILVKLQDGGPVLYRQPRIGRDGKPFTILKLRTMVPDADRLYEALAPTRKSREGPLIKLAADPRRTKVGRWLERLSIDELPQLVNVIRGEMSLVGPRPAQQSEIEAFDDELRRRLEVRPGITGLWQVEARDNASFNAYRRYDLFYLENWSVTLDLAILLATVQRVLLRGTDLITRRRDRAGFANVVPLVADSPVS